MKAGVVADDAVRRTAWAALGQPADLVVELPVALDADGIVPALAFQQIEQRGDGKGRVGAEPESLDHGPGFGGV